MTPSEISLSRVPVHIVAGFLGAGKTTLVLAQIRRRAATERAAVVVNDFGEAGFDAGRLGDADVGVVEIPGGCICCTAPDGLIPAVERLLSGDAVDRIYIEPTGLARPDDLLDTLARSHLAARIELAPVIVVIDPARLLSSPPPPLLLEQVDAADVLVANRVDAASPEALLAFRSLAAEHYPPPLGSFEIAFGQLPEAALDLRRASARPIRALTLRQSASVEGWSVASRGWAPDVVFDMGRLKGWLDQTQNERVKGIFHTDLGWYRMERASGQVDFVPSTHRLGSRVDLIRRGDQSEADAAAASIDALKWTPPPEGVDPVVRLRDGMGREVALTRYALAAIPGQVSDVAALIPGRVGEAVLLCEILDLARPPPGALFVVAASDGMTTAPVPVESAGGAILVHSLDGGHLPNGKGGPYRLLVPPSEAENACAAVKKVVRIHILEEGA